MHAALNSLMKVESISFLRQLADLLGDISKNKSQFGPVLAYPTLQRKLEFVTTHSQSWTIWSNTHLG